MLEEEDGDEDATDDERREYMGIVPGEANSTPCERNQRKRRPGNDNRVTAVDSRGVSGYMRVAY